MENVLLETTLKRRTFLRGTGLLGSGLFLLTLEGCDSIAEAIRNRPMRRRVRTGSPELDRDLDIYKRAITAMKALPSTDKRSWAFQASLHGTSTGFTNCAHGINQFVSWHRAYLLYFEQICRELTGEPRFALPYWNWCIDPAVPSQFLDPTSVLYSPRNNTTMAGQSAVAPATLERIMQYDDFDIFWQSLEGSPHNRVHSYIGGVLGNYNSPLDPLFWMHHCMVDYCWASWNITRGHDNPPADSAWGNVEWDYFVDGKGNPVKMQAKFTPLMPLLSYQYEESQIGNPVRALVMKSNTEFETLKKRVEAGTRDTSALKQVIPVAAAAQIKAGNRHDIQTNINQTQFSNLVKEAANDRLFATIKFAKQPDVNDFYVRVFVNNDKADVNTPESDAHFAGSFAFFGTSPASTSGNGPQFLIDLTDTVNNLRQQNVITDTQPLSLHLVAVPSLPDQRQATGVMDLEKIDIVVRPVKMIAQK